RDRGGPRATQGERQTNGPCGGTLGNGECGAPAAPHRRRAPSLGAKLEVDRALCDGVGNRQAQEPSWKGRERNRRPTPELFAAPPALDRTWRRRRRTEYDAPRGDTASRS